MPSKIPTYCSYLESTLLEFFLKVLNTITTQMTPKTDAIYQSTKMFIASYARVVKEIQKKVLEGAFSTVIV